MNKKMLVLPMKKKWFDMILSGDKKQEFRELKPYWINRVDNWQTENGVPATMCEFLLEVEFKELLPILFVNGYGARAPRFIGWSNGYSVRFDVMHKEWGEGAYDGIGHYAFAIVKVEKE